MNSGRGQTGAALLEFAMALPFALALFVGIADFSVYFWRQTEMEETARFAAVRIAPKVAEYVIADEAGLRKFARILEQEARNSFRRKDLTFGLTRHYSCPLASGAEEAPTSEPRGCAGERVYLRVAGDDAVEPLLRPLKAMGYPKTAFSRHVIRLR